MNNEVLSWESLLLALENDSPCKPEEKMQILLTYDAQTSYQDYLTTKVFLMENEINCSPVEYVYTVK